MLNEQIDHIKEELKSLNNERDQELKKVQEEYTKRTKDLSQKLALLEKRRRTEFLADYLHAAFRAIQDDKNASVFMAHDAYTKEYEVTYLCDPILGIGDALKLLLQFQIYEPGHSATLAPYGPGPKLILWVEHYSPSKKKELWHHRLIHSFDADMQKLSRKEFRKIVADDLKDLTKKKFKTIPGSWTKF